MRNRLFVANLSWSVTEEEIERLFSQVGQIVSIHIPKDRESGRGRGFAFIEMGTANEAQEAISQFHGQLLHERDLVVTIQNENKRLNGGNGQPYGTPAENNKLFVHNVAYSVTDSDLLTLFSQVGSVISARIPTDRETYQSKGFAFVEMANATEAKAAISQLDGAVVGGKALAIKYQDPTRSRPKANYNREQRDNSSYGYERSNANRW